MANSQGNGNQTGGMLGQARALDLAPGDGDYQFVGGAGERYYVLIWRLPDQLNINLEVKDEKGVVTTPEKISEYWTSGVVQMPNDATVHGALRGKPMRLSANIVEQVATAKPKKARRLSGGDN